MLVSNFSSKAISLFSVVMAFVLIAFASMEVRAEGAGQPEFGDEFFCYPHANPHQQPLDALVGKPCPAIRVADWINGEVKSKDAKGKVIVVDIWATWCGPCLRSIPHNNEMKEKYKGKGLLIIGVCSSGNGQEKLRDVAGADKTKINYPACKDPGEKTAKAFHVSFYPTYVVIDRNGVVRAAGARQDKVEAIVEKLLAEKAN